VSASWQRTATLSIGTRSAERSRSDLAPELHAGIAGEIRLREVDYRPILSDRERETLKLVAEGLTAPEIGRRLHLSTGTVKTHLAHPY
jgi:two-component system, NarL family, nitrate/nitrite response regulator NarL